MLFDLEGIWTDAHNQVLEDICLKYDPYDGLDFIVERTKNVFGFSDEEWDYLFDLHRSRIRVAARVGLIANAVGSLAARLADLTEAEMIDFIGGLQEPIRDALWRREEDNGHDDRYGDLLKRLEWHQSEACEAMMSEPVIECENFASGLAEVKHYELINIPAHLERIKEWREQRRVPLNKFISKVETS